MSILRLGELDFTIDRARLDAFVDEDLMQLIWGLDIKTQPGIGAFTRWSPRVRAETILASSPGDLSDWLDLGDADCSWSKPYDMNDEPFATLYVFEHYPIYDSWLRVERIDQGLFLRWKAKSDVNWNGPFIRGVELEIETNLDFEGIWFGKASEDMSRGLLSNFLNPEGFEFVQTEHQVSLFRPIASESRSS